MQSVTLHGRVIVNARIRLLTGLHIGGSSAALAIGALDNPVVRDSLTGRPYVPGSSVRGKMRSLTEKLQGKPQNWRIGQVSIHICEEADPYERCDVCRIFGVPGQMKHSFPTRLYVRDSFLAEESEQELREQARTDLPYTEVKWEASIDRVTSAAVPRQIERVPAGAVFGPLEMVFSLYKPDDLALLKTVFQAMQLLEDDYLGGLGSRGSGKIRFENLSISVRNAEDYGTLHKWPIEGDKDQGLTVQNVLDKLGSVPGPGVAPDEDTLLGWLSAQVPIAEDATAS